MARQSNLAYDFERFEVQAQKPKEKVKIKVVSQRQQKRQNRYFVAKVAALRGNSARNNAKNLA